MKSWSIKKTITKIKTNKAKQTKKYFLLKLHKLELTQSFHLTRQGWNFSNQDPDLEQIRPKMTFQPTINVTILSFTWAQTIHQFYACLLISLTQLVRVSVELMHLICMRQQDIGIIYIIQASKCPKYLTNLLSCMLH